MSALPDADTSLDLQKDVLDAIALGVQNLPDKLGEVTREYVARPYSAPFADSRTVLLPPGPSLLLPFHAGRVRVFLVCTNGGPVLFGDNPTVQAGGGFTLPLGVMSPEIKHINPIWISNPNAGAVSVSVHAEYAVS